MFSYPTTVGASPACAFFEIGGIISLCGVIGRCNLELTFYLNGIRIGSPFLRVLTYTSTSFFP